MTFYAKICHFLSLVSVTMATVALNKTSCHWFFLMSWFFLLPCVLINVWKIKKIGEYACRNRFIKLWFEYRIDLKLSNSPTEVIFFSYVMCKWWDIHSCQCCKTCNQVSCLTNNETTSTESVAVRDEWTQKAPSFETI